MTFNFLLISPSLIKIYLILQNQQEKLEVADVLELTVTYIRNINSASSSTIYNDVKSTYHYQSGFNDCFNDAKQYLSTDYYTQGQLKLAQGVPFYPNLVHKSSIQQRDYIKFSHSVSSEKDCEKRSLWRPW